MILLTPFVFIFGAIIGSFLNVVILRYNTGTTIGGRSYCFSCGKTLHWYELIPLFSFLAQLGKCRSCKAKISWQYPLVEALTGVLFVVTFFSLLGVQYGKQLFVFDCVIESLLVVMVVYDIRHKIIPDGIVYAFTLLSFGKILVMTPFRELLTFPALWNLLAGPILFLCPFFLLWFISKGKWMGLGDGKLALGIGWFLGLAYGISAIIIGFWIGAVFGILILLMQKLTKGKTALISSLGNLTMKSEIPFGPFLILGLLLVFFFHIDVTGLSYLL